MTNYTDIISAKDIYSLLAFVGYQTKHFEDCSFALTQLEFLEHSDLTKTLYQKLAIAIFSKYEPQNEIPTMTNQYRNRNYVFKICMASGNQIKAQDSIYCCSVCGHNSLNEQLQQLELKHCPLCHTKL